MTPQAALIELLGRVGASQGDMVFINGDELSQWPSAAVAAMKTHRLLMKAHPANNVICPGCEHECAMQVHTLPAEDNWPARASVSCYERDDIGHVPVDFSRLEQWQSTGELIATVLAQLLDLSQPEHQTADGIQWGIGTLRGKKHRSPLTLLAGDGLTLSLAGHTVPLEDMLAIEGNALTLDKAELIRLVDNPAGDSKTGGAAQGTSGNPCDVFLAMKKLTADEVSITFVGDKTEYGIGTNNLLEISARGETKSVALAAIGLIDLHSRSLNEQCATLLGMAQKMNPLSSGANRKKISRLREVFRKHLGISDDPFDPYRKGAGWVPRFKIFDKRGAADKRALREARRATVSLEELTERGAQFGDTNQTQESFDSENDTENDAAADWLKNNDPDAPA